MCVRPCVLQGGYDHYMQKEIHEQPDSIMQTMRGRVNFEKLKAVSAPQAVPSQALLNARSTTRRPAVSSLGQVLGC